MPISQTGMLLNTVLQKAICFFRSIASAMRYKESPADFLGPPSRAIWNPKLIASVIGQLTPDNLLLFLLSHQSGILNWPNLAVTEPWYKIK